MSPSHTIPQLKHPELLPLFFVFLAYKWGIQIGTFSQGLVSVGKSRSLFSVTAYLVCHPIHWIWHLNVWRMSPVPAPFGPLCSDSAVVAVMALDSAFRYGNDTSESSYDIRGLLFIKVVDLLAKMWYAAHSD